LYDSIGLPPNINYAVINIKNEKGTTNGKPSTKLICKQNIHNMLIVSFEDYTLKTIRQSEDESMLHSSSFTFNNSGYKGKYDSMCLDKGIQAFTKAYADTRFSFCHENISINIAL
jgi:hypothetical protein